MWGLMHATIIDHDEAPCLIFKKEVIFTLLESTPLRSNTPLLNAAIIGRKKETLTTASLCQQ